MNQIKLVLSSLALVILSACGGKSDSDSTDAEFLRVSAELKQTLPEVDESLSSESPEGVWRVASHSVFNSSYEFGYGGMGEDLFFLDMEFKSYSQLLLIIQKNDSAENAYIVSICSGSGAIRVWELDGDTLFHETISDSDAYYSNMNGYLVLDNNLSLMGRDSYNFNDSHSDGESSSFYSGVKISDATDFQEAQDLNIDLQINEKDASYRLSDDLINPNCFSISQSEGQLKEYTPATETNNTYNQSSTSFVIEMKDGARIAAYEDTIAIDKESSIDNDGYYSDIDMQYSQLYSCSPEMEAQDDNCLKSLIMTTGAETNSMSASSKGESLTGEAFEVTFSYSQE